VKRLYLPMTLASDDPGAVMSRNSPCRRDAAGREENHDAPRTAQVPIPAAAAAQRRPLPWHGHHRARRPRPLDRPRSRRSSPASRSSASPSSATPAWSTQSSRICNRSAPTPAYVRSDRTGDRNYQVVLEGIGRFQLGNLIHSKPYWTVEGEALPDLVTNPPRSPRPRRVLLGSRSGSSCRRSPPRSSPTSASGSRCSASRRPRPARRPRRRRPRPRH
jgi:hypothetical protein